jgi:transcriptional regulator with XRE-family HTH domain
MESKGVTAIEPRLELNRAKLDELRKANSITTEAELAKIIGVSPATLWRITNRESVPSNGFIARLKIAFPHVALESLFDVATEPRPQLVERAS